MKVGAFTTVFDEVEWLEAIAPQLAIFAPVVVSAATAPCQWSDFDRPPPEAPLEALEALCARHGFALTVGNYRGTGPEAFSHQRAAGMEALRSAGAQAAAWFATDELYRISDAERLRDCLASEPEAVWRLARGACRTYWYNPEWTVSYWAPIPGLPITFDAFRLESGDCQEEARHPARVLPLGVQCWHFAFARPSEEMRRKAFGWGHAHPQHSPAWWKAWDEWRPGAPIYWPPQVPARAQARDALPEELRQRLAPILARLRPTPAG